MSEEIINFPKFNQSINQFINFIYVEMWDGFPLKIQARGSCIKCMTTKMIQKD